ncbi:MAG: shikimate kinase [Candidatus Firestonebacteria bacterium]
MAKIPQAPREPMNITLIGMAGAGKSYIGKALAKKLGYKFLDIDVIIEKKLGKKLRDVVVSLGDKGFVKLEEKTILSLKNPVNTVFSPGGSVVYSPKAMRFLRTVGPVVFLKAPFPVIKKRIPDMSARGLVKFKHKSLHTLYGERLPLYKQYADFVVTLPKGATKTASIKKILKVTDKLSK